MKAMLGEACDPTSQARAMGILNLGWGSGALSLLQSHSHSCTFWMPSGTPVDSHTDLGRLGAGFKSH